MQSSLYSKLEKIAEKSLVQVYGQRWGIRHGFLCRGIQSKPLELEDVLQAFSIAFIHYSGDPYGYIGVNGDAKWIFGKRLHEQSDEVGKALLAYSMQDDDYQARRVLST